MKRNSWLCIAIFWAWILTLTAGGEFQARFDSDNESMGGSAFWHYTSPITGYWFLTHDGVVNADQSDYLSQFRRNSRGVVIVENNLYPYKIGLIIEHRNLLEEGSPDGTKYSWCKDVGTFAIRGTWNPLDEMELVSRIEMNRLEDTFDNASAPSSFLDRGFSDSHSLVFHNKRGMGILDFRAKLDHSDLELERKTRFETHVDWSVQLPGHGITFSAGWQKGHNDLYTGYLATDRQSREFFDATITHSVRVIPRLTAIFSGDFIASENVYDTQTGKDTEDREKRLQAEFRYQLTTLNMKVVMQRGFTERETGDGAIKSSDRSSFSGGINWNFSPGDSVVFHQTLDLTRTDQTGTGLRADNDLLRSDWDLSLYLIPSQRLRMSATFSLLQTHQVYLDADFSADNAWKRSYNLVPEVAFLIAPGILFTQHYELRADFVDYDREDFSANRLFRRLGIEAGIHYDSENRFPGVAGWSLGQDEVDTATSALLSVRYGYTTNESGQDEDEVYLIDAEKETHRAECLYTRPWGLFSLGGLLRVDFNHSWEYRNSPHDKFYRDYTLRIEAGWQPLPQSRIALAVVPTSSDLPEIEWSWEGSVRISF